MTTSLTLQANLTEMTSASFWVGVSLILFGVAMLGAVFGIPWLFQQDVPPGAVEHNGADEHYSAELHAEAEAEPDPAGWSAATAGFDYRVVFERIADGYGAAVSPPPVLFDTLAAQLPAPDPTWLTFDTSAWRTVRAASDELAREYDMPRGLIEVPHALGEQAFEDFRERWHELERVG